MPVAPKADARAASPEPGNAVCHSLRYNDDFTYLADRPRPVTIAAQFLSGPAVQKTFGKTVTFFVLFATCRYRARLAARRPAGSGRND